jgi:hypothetical protein
MVTLTNAARILFKLLALSIVLSGCASYTKIDVTQTLNDATDAPYEKILVVTLFDSFEARRYLEEEIVKQLAEQGTAAVASTSMMNTKTPIVRQTFIDMIDEIGADALLLTQLTAHQADFREVDASPEATYNFRPTYYFNVWQVDLKEYVEPPRLEFDHSLVLVTEVLSVARREPVWAIESKSRFVEIQENGVEDDVFVDEANAIVKHMKSSKLLAR